MNFNSKIFNICVAITLIYLVYQSYKTMPNSGAANSKYFQSQKSKYEIVIDPNVDDSDRTWFEKSILFFFGDKIKEASQKSSTGVNIAEEALQTIVYGDIVHIKISSSDKKLDNVEFQAKIGAMVIPANIEIRLIGLKKGRYSIKDENGTVYSIDILNVSKPNKRD